MVVNPGGFPSTARHIIVLLRDQVYVVDVYDSVTGARLSVKDMEEYVMEEGRTVHGISQFCSQLWAVVNDCFNTPRQPSICILTSEHRDNWAKVSLLEVDMIETCRHEHTWWTIVHKTRRRSAGLSRRTLSVVWMTTARRTTMMFRFVCQERYVHVHCWYRKHGLRKEWSQSMV